MPEATPAANPSPSPEPNGSGVTVTTTSLEERSAAAFGMSDPAGDVSADPSAPPADGASAAGSGEPDAQAQARAERREALKRMQAEERGRVDAMAAIRERDQLRAELQAEREKTKAYEKHIDPSKITKDQFFALAEQNPELTPTELGEWLRERIANPEMAAARAATSAIDPKLAEVKAENAALKARLDAFEQARQNEADIAEEQHYANQFFSFTRENAAGAPHSASFLEKFGPNEFYKLAQSAVPLVPPGAGAQAILDEIEERLSQLGAVYAARPADPQRRQASTPQQNPAAAQAPIHVSNTLAQQRSSVVDEDANWAELPFEERSARVFR